MVVRLVSCVYMNVNYMDWLTTRAFSYSVTAIWTERLSNEPRYQQWNSQPANLMLKGTSFGSCNGKRDGAPARYGWDLAGWRRSETWPVSAAFSPSSAATACVSPGPTSQSTSWASWQNHAPIYRQVSRRTTTIRDIRFKGTGNSRLIIYWLPV